MPKRHYIIYCDESAKKGNHFSNFYGGALVLAEDQQAIESILLKKKRELHLKSEIKWQYITDNYKAKYIEFIDLFFKLIKTGRIKIRIMFTQNHFKPRDLTTEHRDNEYFILYYMFIKHAFGLGKCNVGRRDSVAISLLLDQIPDSDDRLNSFKDYLIKLNTSALF